MTDKPNRNVKPAMLGVGIAIGVAIGVAQGNLAMGIGIGVALGVALGATPAWGCWRGGGATRDATRRDDTGDP